MAGVAGVMGQWARGYAERGGVEVPGALFLALAQWAGQTVAAAAVTNVWESVRSRFARLLGRGDARKTEVAEGWLAQTQQQLAAAAPGELEKARRAAAERWAGCEHHRVGRARRAGSTPSNRRRAQGLPYGREASRRRRPGPRARRTHIAFEVTPPGRARQSWGRPRRRDQCGTLGTPMPGNPNGLCARTRAIVAIAFALGALESQGSGCRGGSAGCRPQPEMRKVFMVRFRVVDRLSSETMTSHDFVYLSPTDWDDWFKFSTLFDVAYSDPDGRIHDIGGTKIGTFGLKPAGRDEKRGPGYRRPQLPGRFDELGEEYFSLGQDTSYYEALTNVSSTFREDFLHAIRDISYDPVLLDSAKTEQVTKVSLLREVPLATVREQFARLARGGARLTPYNFTFPYSWNRLTQPIPVGFSVNPSSKTPSNIHVIIGRNGVGKTTFLNKFALAMVLGSQGGEDGKAASATREQLSNVVSVSFSAFDAFEPITVSQDRTKGITYHYIGLKKIANRKDEVSTPKDPAALSREMSASAKVCLVGARRPRLKRALQLLESDPIFCSVGLAELISPDEADQELLLELPAIFRRLSSGHKIVLLTVTKLVETVEEKSLVLMDEPEAHLHPPLLSAFIRALSDLLTNRNGVAIVATHSPVVLQEVPRDCVWRLQRSGDVIGIDRPQIETFGENVGTLTDEIFGLEVTATGFHKMLADAAAQAHSYEEALAQFDGQLGAEGRAILRAMMRPVEVRNVGW